MKPLHGLSDYLGAIEKRLRWIAFSRGAAVTAASALVLTVLAVLVANKFAFSGASVIGARLFLFLGLAFAIAGALIIPVIRLNRRRAARAAEARYPQFEERLLTFTERMEQNGADPFLPLLADDALAVAQQAKPHEVAKSSWIFSFSSAALAAMMALVWLGISGPGFLGYGTSLLWGGVPKGEIKPFYNIKVTPGNLTIRKRADQVITATLSGFTAPKVRFFARYASASQWEQAEMRTEPGGSAYEFMIAGVPETLDYYVEAGGVHSDTYKLTVIDLPSVKKIKVTYRYPAWSGLPNTTEDPGGDLRAVEGTNAEVVVETDRPLSSGALLLDDGTKLALKSQGGNLIATNVEIRKDGMYHIAAVENGEDVRLTNDYFIEAMKDNPPEIKVTRPGRDFRATPIEEVTIAIDAKDDFGLRSVDLHYSVNGGPDKTVSMLQTKGAKTATGSTVLSLEDFKVVPGDIVSLYATAKDARQTTSTDMFFIEAQPFERNYSQSQQAGGGGGGGDDDAGQQNQISQREKEIITATWNQVKGQGARGTDAENAGFLSGVQAKLRDQAKSLAERMKARALETAGDSFKSFVTDMEQAADAMGPASDKLKGAKWQDALAPEQKALQFLLRAEATFRDIQVAFGQQGGGGGGGGGNGATRDMEGLFDLELDTEKNQYEGARQTQSADARQRQIDDAMEKLKELARRQQELAEQQKKGQQTSQQRWEQEQLRREAEQLRQQMEQMVRNSDQALSRNGQPQPGQQGQQGQQSQGGQPGQQGQQSQQSQQNGQPGQMGQMTPQQQQAMQQQQQNQRQNQQLRGADAETLRKTLEQLKQAEDDMRNAASSQQAGTPQGSAAGQRALESLQQAQQAMQGMRTKQSNGQVDDLVRQADDLARKQQEFEGQLRRAFSKEDGLNQQQAGQVANQRQDEINQLKQVEQQMQNAVRDLASTQRQASTKMRDALGQMQQQELARDMQRNADWIRRGMGEYAVMSESQITAGLNDLRDNLHEVQKTMGAAGSKGQQDDKTMERALASTEQLRRQLEQMAGRGGQQPGQQPGQQGQQQLSRNGQQGGQQKGGQQQGGQQAGGQQQGGQQAGGQQQGGQQAGGQQQGGQQAGGQQQGGQQQGGNNNGGNYMGGFNGGNLADHGGAWGGRFDPQAFQGTYRDAMVNLQQLQQQMKDDPGTQRDIQGAIRDLRNLDPLNIGNEPLLSERINAALANIEQVEMELRRKVEDATGGGSVRSPGSQPVPQGYSEAVAEYFRKLSNSKK